MFRKVKLNHICNFLLLFVLISCVSGVKTIDVTKHNSSKNFAVVISGPSGVGKTTIANELLKNNHDLVRSVSITTRKPRHGEVNHIDYHFISQQEFQEMKQKGELLEYVSNFHNSYGTPKYNYQNAISGQKNVIFVVDSNGMLEMKKHKDLDIVTIFIAPPSIESLGKRLSNRKTESKASFKQRLANAAEEMKNATSYDYIVYNYELHNAIKTVNAIYLAEKQFRY